MLIPWSAFWDRNYFVQWSSQLSAVLTSNYTRGAFTGLGLLNVWAALAELGDMFGNRPSTDRQSEINPQSDIRDPQ
jgi:hypothetical protein